MRHKGAGMWKEKCNVVVLMLSWRCVYVQRNGQETGGPAFVALTEASKLESAMVCVAERMLFRHPKRQPGLRPSTGLCVWWAIGRLWGHVFPCLVANIPFTVFDSTSPCDFSGKKYERNQSANKLRVLSQREREKKKKKRKERPERLWILTESSCALWQKFALLSQITGDVFTWLYIFCEICKM